MTSTDKPSRQPPPDSDGKQRSAQHSEIRAAIESYIPSGPSYDVERNALLFWLDEAVAAKCASDAVLEIEHPPPDAAAKCPGCAVRHVFGAHAVVIGCLTWHSTCAVRSQEAAIEVMERRLEQYKGISEALRIAAERDPGLERIADDPGASVRALIQRNAQLRGSVPVGSDDPAGAPIAIDVYQATQGDPIGASGGYYKLSEVRRSQDAKIRDAALDAIRAESTRLTIEEMYPVCADPLRIMRDTTASAFDRIDAAKILCEMGMDRNPLMRDDVRAAAQGDLGRTRSAMDQTVTIKIPPLDTASDLPACADLPGFVHGQLGPARADAFRAHIRTCHGCRTGLVATVQLDSRLSELGEGETVSLRPGPRPIYPTQVRVLLAVRDALIGLEAAQEPIPRTEQGFAVVRDAVRARLGSDAVSVTGDDRGRLKVMALGCEVIW